MDTPRTQAALPRALDFAIVGAPKSGTTSLSQALSKHRDVHILDPKDGHFFQFISSQPAYTGPGGEDFNSRIRSAKEGCREQASRVPSTEVLGDISVFYMYHDEALLALRNSLGNDSPVIACLRHPAERAFSAYTHKCRDGVEPLSFSEALEAESDRIAAGWTEIWWYKTLGYYSEAVERLYSIFGTSRVHVVLYEDLLADPSCLQEIGRLAGLNSPSDLHLPHANASGQITHPHVLKVLSSRGRLKRAAKTILPATARSSIRRRALSASTSPKTVPEGDRRYLTSLYSNDIKALDKLIEPDVSHWLASE